ncbi:unnamed protein product [Taenia asiatica]|uniref:TPT domain-containing protein n=1 Tax=Taenia asiatica TaxID=60517 RepID=A0A0R3W9N2_TAEAS|nr:unnamed protein product [Taenia asiatica]
MSMLSAAYVHTIKTSVPVFVVAFSCCLGKRYSFKLTQFRKAAYMLVLDGVARCSQNLLAIVVLSRLTALGYSVASVVKRLFVILTAIVFFATPASAVTFFGIGLAMTGLLLYNLNYLST